MRTKRRRGPLAGEYGWREMLASDIREIVNTRPLTDAEKAAADKLEDEAWALRDLEKEKGE